MGMLLSSGAARFVSEAVLDVKGSQSLPLTSSVQFAEEIQSVIDLMQWKWFGPGVCGRVSGPTREV
jgi:hypothetical protein